MFERFGHLLTKELHDRGFSRLDPVGEPLPVERHGAWEWTFHKTGPELNHYVIAALIPLGEPSTKTGRVLRVEIAIGADNRERNIRSSYFDDLLTEDQLSIWPKALLAAVREAIGGAERFTRLIGTCIHPGRETPNDRQLCFTDHGRSPPPHPHLPGRRWHRRQAGMRRRQAQEGGRGRCPRGPRQAEAAVMMRGRRPLRTDSWPSHHRIPSRPLTGYVASAFDASTLTLFAIAGVAVKSGDVEAASSSPSEINSSVVTIR
jgi:hypothetical protein